MQPLLSNHLLTTIADDLLSAGCIKFGDFTLKSGLKSPIYIDLRMIISHPKLLEQIGAAYLPLLKTLIIDRIAGLPYAAIPIATAISLQGGYPMIYPRKEVKTYGTKAEIEGEYHAGETVVIIDDLATTGGSKFEAIEKLTGAGLVVRDVVVLIDRQSGAKESLAQAGYTLHAVLTIAQLLDYWESTGKVDKDKIKATRDFLEEAKQLPRNTPSQPPFKMQVEAARSWKSPSMWRLPLARRSPRSWLLSTEFPIEEHWFAWERNAISCSSSRASASRSERPSAIP